MRVHFDRLGCVFETPCAVRATAIRGVAGCVQCAGLGERKVGTAEVTCVIFGVVANFCV